MLSHNLQKHTLANSYTVYTRHWMQCSINDIYTCTHMYNTQLDNGYFPRLLL